MAEYTQKDRDIGRWKVRPDILTPERRKEVNESGAKWAKWIRLMLKKDRENELKKGDFDNDTGEAGFFKKIR